MNDINALLPDVLLRFNIDKPNLEECYAFGFDCGQHEVAETENPFKAGTREACQWEDGWWDAFYGEKSQYALASAEDAVLASAANESSYPRVQRSNLLIRLVEITGVIAVSALLGFYLVDMVA